jgi:CheY-like chemotaxis protein
MAEKILLVDDEPNVLDGFRRTLGREFMLETAVGGQEALASYREGTVCRGGF